MYGHTHSDEFRVINSYFEPKEPVGIVYTAPSLTTSNFFHPSFRVFEIDSNTKQLIDYVQYRLNITKANLDPIPSNKPKWDIAYRASEEFQARDLVDFNRFADFIERIQNRTGEYKMLMRHFFNDGPMYKEYVNNPGIMFIKLNIEDMSKFMYCRFKENTFDDYLKCTRYRTCNKLILNLIFI